MEELDLIGRADTYAADYLASVTHRRVFPDQMAIQALSAFDEPLPQQGCDGLETLALMAGTGSPGTVTSNGPHYFGFVVGATLPIAAAAERLMLAWDQCASSFNNSPIAAKLESVAAEWILDALDLPRQSAVGFGTSATASTVSCLTAARRSLLERHGWNFDEDGLFHAPEIKVIVSDLAHVTVKKALRILGFGINRLLIARTDSFGRIDPDQLPPMDDMTILCLQAGEVNTGEFDPFSTLIPKAKQAGAWVHVDGAFGLWARATPRAADLARDVDQADSWTTDGHKWLNTPYDGAMAICRDPTALAKAMNSDAAYAMASVNAQKNLTLEFSRRARGIPVWAALRSLGRNGIASMIERHIDQAQKIGQALKAEGFDILNRIVLNQVLVRCDDDQTTLAIQKLVSDSGRAWFGTTIWRGRPAFRISVSSWRTQDADIDDLVSTIIEARDAIRHAAS